MSQQGTITWVALNGVNIHHDYNQTDVTLTPSIIPPLNQRPIMWDNPSLIPPSLQSVTLTQLLGMSVTSHSPYTTSIALTGQQTGRVSTPYTEITSVDGRGLTSMVRFNAGPPSSGDLLTYNGTSNINSSILHFGVIQSLTVVNHSNELGISYDATNMTLTITITVTLLISCSGSNLSTPQCQALCENGNVSCLQAFNEFCFSNNRIGTDGTCQQYYKDYIENNGPNASIDAGLQSYCTSKYNNFSELFSSTSTQDIDMCACHMQPEQYTNFQQELFTQFPQLSSIPGITTKCLLSQCLNSDYQSEPIPKGGCKTPNCVVINEFQNNGTFNNSSVNFNTNISGCNGNSDSEDILGIPIEWWIAIIVVIVIVIALIIWWMQD